MFVAAFLTLAPLASPVSGVRVAAAQQIGIATLLDRPAPAAGRAISRRLW